jgi:hypothetical protein
MHSYQRKRSLSWWILRAGLIFALSIFISLVNLLPSSSLLQEKAFASGANTIFMESGTDATKDFKFWSFAPTGGSSDCATAETGPCSIQVNSGAGQAVSVAIACGVLADAGRRISFYYKFDNFGTIDALFAKLYTAGPGNNLINFGVQQSSKKLYIQSTANLGSTVLSTGTWYRITISYTVTDTTHNQWRLYLNGNSTPEVSLSNYTLSQTGTDCLELGDGTSNAGTNIIQHIDDVYIDDGNTLDDPGDIHVTAKLPNADNTHQFVTNIGNNPGAGSYYTNVNERPVNVANGWRTSSASQSENYTIESASQGDVDISTATLIADSAWVYASSGSSCTGNITNNGTSTASISLTTSNTMFTNIVSNASYPSNSAAVGIKSCPSATQVNLYETSMLIAYTPSGGSGAPEGALLILPIIPFVPTLVHSLLAKWHKRRRHT